jgi:hypothetical protein
MDNSNLLHNNHKLSFTESNNLQSTAAVTQYPPNVVATNSDFFMNDDDIIPTSQIYPFIDHQSCHPINLQQSTSSHAPQYNHLNGLKLSAYLLISRKIII